MASNVAETFERAEALALMDPTQAAQLYRSILSASDAELGEDTEKYRERSIFQLGELLATNNRAAELVELFTVLRPMFATMTKARVAKIVRTLVQNMSQIPETLPMQIELVLDQIAWAKSTNRKLLVQRLEASLAELYHLHGEHARALSLIDTLLKEVKRVDDKLLLLELHLVESQAHHSLKDVPKAKASLTSARTAANAIFCPPLVQAKIDIQAGIIQADEGDFKTAYSYFYEAFEGFSGLVDTFKTTAATMAQNSLKYLLLCKVMLGKPEEVNSILNSNKIALKISGPCVEAMRAVAAAGSARSLELFQTATVAFKSELVDDPIINSHLSALQDSLFESNLARLIEPFSCVELAHVAQLIGISVDRVEAKLSKMILDRKLAAVIDQNASTLVLYDEAPSDRIYAASMSAVGSMNEVVDALFEKVKRLS